MFLQHVGGGLQREPRLADATDTDQRHEPVRSEQRLDLGLLPFPADERCDLLRQVVRRGLQRAQRRKVSPQLWMHDLVDALGAREIAQAHARRSRFSATPFGRRLQIRSATAFDASTCPPCAAAMMRAVRLTGAPKTSLSRRSTTPRCSPQRRRSRVPPVSPGFKSACCSSSAASTASSGSSKTAWMPSPVVLTTMPRVRLDGRPRDRVVARQCRLHLLGLPLPQPGAALDVGKQNGSARDFARDHFGNSDVRRNRR